MAEIHSHDDEVLGYTNSKSFGSLDSVELGEPVTYSKDRSIDHGLHQMEIRFKNVSTSAELVDKKDNTRMKLPSIANDLMDAVRSMITRKRTNKKMILQEVSGVFKPGTITLVLGQPGSGKSALMKLLSGRFPKKQNITIEGEVTYNGTPASDVGNILPQLVSYVQQHDKHYPELTVKETLEFAHSACGGDVSPTDVSHFVNGSAQENAEAVEAAQVLSKNYTYVVIQQLGLENCQNTVVGDAMLRGVSRGERKRVTTGEMAFGNKYVMMMDEISTGLDSAATFDIITTQRSIAKEFRKTVVISLLQPSPEVFALFDNVMIMNAGRLIYHGLSKEVLNYFENIGFKCPPFCDVADFLLDLGTRNQFEYEVCEEVGRVIPRTAKEFAEAFESSTISSSMLESLQDPVHPILVHDMESIMTTHLQFVLSRWSSTKLLMKRQLIITRRQLTSLVSRLMVAAFMALLCSSAYYQFNAADAQLTMGIAFTSVLSLILYQFLRIPDIINAREVFYKQREANFFPTASYVLSNAINEAVLIIVETILYASITYWTCAFVDEIWSFVIFLVILCLTNLWFGAFSFFLACASPNVSTAKWVSSGIIIVLVLFAGFTTTKDQIQEYLVWIYWLNPLSWSVRALVVNQYTDAQFDVCMYDGIDYCLMHNKTMGKFSLSSYEVPPEKYWIWYGMVYSAASYVLFLFLSYIALEYHRYEDHAKVLYSSESPTDDYGLARTPRSSLSDHETTFTVNTAEKTMFIPATVAFRDLWYTVPDPANPKETIALLKGISGYALPGTITALMGSSGAGKTTLMDVIAGRKTGGKIQGQILLNGHPATDLAIRRSTGYCEQMDIHSESSTIREALTFSAFLRQGADVPDSYKYASVDECLDLLGLNPIADQIIRGSSVEQMKRLTIGVELAAQPSVLFLDEPTSGLDARSAKLIMDGVRKVANTGRTIICTIHQPSAEVFRVFDSLLLLKRGGETVFAGELGENASEMIDYFESINGVTKLKDNYNPATWMLELIGAGTRTDFAKIYQLSTPCERWLATLENDGISLPSLTYNESQITIKRGAAQVVQLKFLMKRVWNLYWRTSSFNLTRFNFSQTLGLLLGFMYLDVEYASYTSINSGMGMLFVAMALLGLVAFDGMVSIAAVERTVFYRERSSHTYNMIWYIFATSVMELLYVFIDVLLFLVSLYPMVGFKGTSGFLNCWVIFSCYTLLQAYIAEFLVFLLPNTNLVNFFGIVVFSISFIFSGFSPPASSLPSSTKWLHDIVPMSYSLSAVATTVFGQCSGSGDIGCREMTNIPPTLAGGITVKEHLEVNFLMKDNEFSRNCGVLAAILLLVRVLTLLAMRICNYRT